MFIFIVKMYQVTGYFSRIIKDTSCNLSSCLQFRSTIELFIGYDTFYLDPHYNQQHLILFSAAMLIKCFFVSFCWLSSPCACMPRCSFVYDFGLQPAMLLCPRNFPGKNTRVDCHALLQGIFPIQRLNAFLLRLLHCRQILYR